MFYGKVPMMIFILASGYLFTVYLLLALAKRSENKNTSKDSSVVSSSNHIQDMSVTANVTEIVNSQ
ncbi:hypothetical protein [Calothrix sp. 336/3]|uniref:hypothetical protein n=1 Tax=Calothrix sp. 336/3 TaxID=1337936 RepID=UPI0004E45088|nr:hypothetical protein [Calothrix sp. 336/3]